tara:strand:+ start:684 stop:1472 length:789 start_codon:yes stop_codon:yes gene_type:complete
MNPTHTFDFDQLKSLVPAAFATKAADFVSDKYTFVDTAEIISDLYGKGWRAVSATQARSRKSDPLTEKHTIVLRQGGVESVMPELGELFGALRYTGSHNHTSKVIASQELLRLVCGNGMSVSEGEFGKYSIRHDMITEDIRTIMARFESQNQKQMATAEEWSKLELTQEQTNSFLVAATKLRFGDKATLDKTTALNKSRRWEDNGNTLWRVFNRVQENGMQGAPKAGEMKRKVRGLTNIDTMQAWNDGLKDIAYETRQLVLA